MSAIEFEALPSLASTNIDEQIRPTTDDLHTEKPLKVEQMPSPPVTQLAANPGDVVSTSACDNNGAALPELIKMRNGIDGQNGESSVAGSSKSTGHRLTNGTSADDADQNQDEESGPTEDSADDEGADAEEAGEVLASPSSRRSGLRDRSRISRPVTWSDELADFSQPDLKSGTYSIKDGLVYSKSGSVLMTADRLLALNSNTSSPRRPMRRARNRMEIEEQQKKVAETSAKKQEAEERRVRKEEIENSRKERDHMLLEREKLKLEQLKLKEQDRLRRESEKAAKLLQTKETQEKRKEELERKLKEKCQRDEEAGKKRAEKDKVKLAEQEAVRKQQQILSAFVKKVPASLSQSHSQPKNLPAFGRPVGSADTVCEDAAEDADIIPIAFVNNDASALANQQSTYLGPFFDMQIQAPMSKAAQDDFLSMVSVQSSSPKNAAVARSTFLNEVSAGTRRYASREPVIPRVVRDIDRLPDLLDGFRNKAGVQIEPRQVRMKTFKFFEEYRPGYYGTKINASSIVTPRDPFRKDTKLLDYDVDSDDEWDLGIEPDMEVDECSDAESTAGDEEKVGGASSKTKRVDADAAGDDDDEDSDEEFVIKDEDAWKTENALGVTFSNFFGNDSGEMSANAALASRFDLSMKYYNSRTKKGKPEKRVPRLMGPFYAELNHSSAELKEIGVVTKYFSRLAAIDWVDPDTNELGVACRVKQQSQSASQQQSASSQQPNSSQANIVPRTNPVKATRATLAAAVEEEDEAELKILMQQQRQKVIVDENGNIMLMDTSTSLAIASDGVMNVTDDDDENNGGGNAEEVDRLTAEDKEELVEIYEQCTRQACVGRTGSDWQLAQRERRGKLRREAKQQALVRGLKLPAHNDSTDPNAARSGGANSWTSSGFGEGEENESEDEDFVLTEKDAADEEDDDDDESSTVGEEDIGDSSSSEDEKDKVTAAGSSAGSAPAALKKREPKLTQQTLSLVKKKVVVQPSVAAVSKSQPATVVDDDDSVLEVEPTGPPLLSAPQEPQKWAEVKKSEKLNGVSKKEKLLSDTATASRNNSPLRKGVRKTPCKSESDGDDGNLDDASVPSANVKEGKLSTVDENVDEQTAQIEPKPKRRRIQLTKID